MGLAYTSLQHGSGASPSQVGVVHFHKRAIILLFAGVAGHARAISVLAHVPVACFLCVGLSLVEKYTMDLTHPVEPAGSGGFGFYH